MAAGSTGHSNPYRFQPLRISRHAAETIESWTDALLTDEISLAALPPSLHRLYQVGVADGREQRDHDVRVAQLEADRLWLVAFGDRERREYLLDRLDRIAAMTDPDAELDVVFESYCESLVDVRRGVTPC
ncbi:hypothetical protein [Mycolicibacterium sp.]|uniref:hypothetical protein n=1 Tax=Mycolicibacterium sp. TaxID=2320850 RepID=UPI0037CC316A